MGGGVGVGGTEYMFLRLNRGVGAVQFGADLPRTRRFRGIAPGGRNPISTGTFRGRNPFQGSEGQI